MNISKSNQNSLTPHRRTQIACFTLIEQGLVRSTRLAPYTLSVQRKKFYEILRNLSRPLRISARFHTRACAASRRLSALRGGSESRSRDVQAVVYQNNNKLNTRWFVSARYSLPCGTGLEAGCVKLVFKSALRLSSSTELKLVSNPMVSKL